MKSRASKIFFSKAERKIDFEGAGDLTEDWEKVTERELARKGADGDEAAFTEIVRRFSPRVFRVAAKFFKNYSQIEEAAQEIFLKAFVQLGNFEARGSLEGWLTRIAATTCINLLRAAGRQPELVHADLTADESVWLEQMTFQSSLTSHRQEEDRFIHADLLDRVLRTLPPEDALILQMIDGDGEAIRDVAEWLNWSESKVKVRAFRARRRFREIVRQLLPPTN